MVDYNVYWCIVSIPFHISRAMNYHFNDTSMSQEMTDKEVDGIVERIDAKSEAFLWTMYENDGSATTEEIRKRTGLSNEERTYRFNLLADLGLIEAPRYVQSDHGIKKQKWSKLTHLGQNIVDDGLQYATIELLDNHALETRVERLEELLEVEHEARMELEERLSKVESWRQNISQLLQ